MGAGDFHAAILQVFWQRGDAPVAVANGFGFGEEAGQLSGVEFLLSFFAGGQ